MTERSLSFGAAAHDYEQHRPGYPDWVAQRIVGHAHGQVHSALEIGAGTGKATRVFAAHDIRVLATDPDPLMLAELRRHVPDTVRTRCTTLEANPPGEVYDLVYAAASLHWTDPATRFARIAAMLRPGGVFASFGGPVRLVDPELIARVSEAISPFLETDSAPRQETTPGPEGLEWPGSELAASPAFTDVVALSTPEREWVTAEAHIAGLATVSAYLMLPASDRAEVFDRIRAVLPERVEVGRDLRLHMARRVDDGS